MYNDMQMYVDQTLSNFYQRITSDLTCLCREKTMGYFKELQEQQRDLSKKVEKLSVSPKPIPIEEFIGNQSFDRAYFEAEPVPDDISTHPQTCLINHSSQMNLQKMLISTAEENENLINEINELKKVRSPPIPPQTQYLKRRHRVYSPPIHNPRRRVRTQHKRKTRNVPSKQSRNNICKNSTIEQEKSSTSNMNQDLIIPEFELGENRLFEKEKERSPTPTNFQKYMTKLGVTSDSKKDATINTSFKLKNDTISSSATQSAMLDAVLVKKNNEPLNKSSNIENSDINRSGMSENLPNPIKKPKTSYNKSRTRKAGFRPLMLTSSKKPINTRNSSHHNLTQHITPQNL
ncbi:unnamed protein product [Moneuplotes crassus]|uniref:Uncharacterized protein n=1 Tax=Euplotes crassus TaxID=5936 RepID=A0AAD1UMY3_EUPCR|nr:unnamed protein product [Moneuplotes crassus]